MKELIQAVEIALATRNWYGALAVALTLPDICGKIDAPTAGSRARYAQWFETYVGHKYVSYVGVDRQRHVFLSGDDCYALRCAYLHEGSDDITLQRARDALDRFRMVVSPPGSVFHNNRVNSKLQLDVAHFCRDILSGIHQWLKSNPEIPFENFLTIEELDLSKGFTL